MSRPPLSSERVIDAASRVADAGGLAGVSMRTVGRELGVEAMSLYHHVASKDALLDGLADWIFARIETPTVGGAWREQMEARARSARAVLAAHPWGLGLIESRRSPGPANLHHHDAVLGCLRTAGFSVALAAHAFSVLDAYVYGFVLTEVNLPFQPGEPAEDFVEGLGLVMAEHPHLAEMVAEQIVGRDYAYGDEFDYGLALVLDGLEARFRSPGG
ncbi:AcrR family transcriptional regulator [Nocardioides sp. BE266]|uniref:TetR/AcrR family transcriptional regulator n=1 Tax=Nocardioides sp. BE266 TaxID=2817725 RepID=UPI00285CE2C4|nr:TetR/AcrR family transcriptional regulator [Nocardioides sp. BE266]MDR7251563.1 AcrR family transcriptional regulator [Nocardioides sp. BE266]